MSEAAAQAGLNFSLQEVEELIEATDALDDNRNEQEEKKEQQQRAEEVKQAELEQQMKRDWHERVVTPLSCTQPLSTSWLSALSSVVLRLVEEEVRMVKLLAGSATTEGPQVRSEGESSDNSRDLWMRYEAIIAQVKQELMQQHVRPLLSTHTATRTYTRHS